MNGEPDFPEQKAFDYFANETNSAENQWTLFQK